jgi:hypothetical protein
MEIRAGWDPELLLAQYPLSNFEPETRNRWR